MLDPEFVKQLANAYVSELTIPELTVEEVSPDETLEALASELMGITDPWGQLVSTIQNILNTVWTTFSEFVLSGVKGFIDWLLKQLSPVLQGVADALQGAMSNLLQVGVTFQGFVNAIMNFPNWFPTWFKDNIAKPISDAIGAIWSLIPDWLRSALTAIPDAVKALKDALVNFFSDPVGVLQRALGYLASQIWSLLPSWVKDALTGVQSAVKSVGDALGNFFKDPVGVLKQGFSWLADQIWSLLPDWFKNALTTVQNALNAFWQGLQDFLKDPLGFLQRGFTWLADQIWKLLPDWLKGFIQWVDSSLRNIWSAVTGWFNWLWGEAQKFAKDPLGYIGGFVTWIGQSIWNLFPDWFKGAVSWFGERIEDVKTGLGWLIKGFAEFTEDPWTFTKDKIITPLADFIMKLLNALRDLVGGALGSLVEGFFNAGRALTEGLNKVVIEPAKKIGEDIFGMLGGFIKWMQGLMGGVVKGLTEQVTGVLDGMFKEMRKFMADKYPVALFGGKVEGEEVGELGLFLRSLIPSIALSLASILLPGTFYFASHVSAGFRDHFRATHKEIGTIGRWFLTVWAAFNEYLYYIGENLTDLIAIISAGGILSMQKGFMTPIVYPATALWRNAFNWMGLGDLPITTPSDRDIITMMHRTLPTTWASVMVEKASLTWNFYGYPEWWYIYYLNTTKQMVEEIQSKYAPVVTGVPTVVVKQPEGGMPFPITRLNPPPPYIEIMDRFNNKRMFPTSPVFPLPSISELATMMVRDQFKNVDEFVKAAMMQGVVPDIAYMYYLLHFRYPPTERLWTFFWRASSGLAWYVPSGDEYNDIIDEALTIGAKIPVAPTELNPQGKKPSLKIHPKLTEALSKYMKWYDYARFAWIDGFTSDSWIIVDTAADLPGKIDVRWMAKWGVFDLLSKKGVDYTTPVWGFVEALDDTSANPLLEMDLTNMSRMIQATGMHPALVPWVTASEVINALTDERTLVRTGFVNLFRYGIMDYSDLDRLMGQMAIASFKVAYLDIRDRTWKEKYVNYPIQYLPPERRLLALRAAIDRVTRVHATIERQILGAYYDNLLTGDDALAWIQNSAKALSPALEATTQAISGTKVGLTVDADYFKSVLKAAANIVPIRNQRRTRFIVNRVLGWIIYRVAYGYFTADDAKVIADEMAKIAKYSDSERQAIQSIIELMTKITRREAHREYIPTPSMLATIAEIVPAARGLFDKVVKARDIPSEWVPIWRQYVALRPIVDEVRNVISETLQLFYNFLIKPEDLKKFLDTLMKFGYEADEIGLILDRANARRWREAWRELVGTPRELVTMAEYVPEARKLALAEVKKRIDAMPIPDADKQFLYKLWEDYIRIRPVYDQVESEVTELINDYADGIIDDDFLDWALNELKKWGIDEYEADAIRFIAFMRRQRRLRSRSSS